MTQVTGLAEWDADGTSLERATAIVDGVEWAMNNALPASGESSTTCHRRRMIEAIAAELAEVRSLAGLTPPPVAVEDEERVALVFRAALSEWERNREGWNVRPEARENFILATIAALKEGASREGSTEGLSTLEGSGR